MFTAICFITMVNPALMKACPRQEQFGIYYVFFMLVLQFVLISALMANTLHFMMSMQVATAIAVLVALIIVSLEVRMLSSDLRQSGFLASKGGGFAHYRLLIARIVLALCFAYIYGVGAELILQQDAIDDVLTAQQRNANTTLYQLADSQQAAMTDKLNKVQNQITDLTSLLQSQQSQLTQLNKKNDQLQQQKIKLDALLVVEELGLNGRPPGRELQWWDYKNQLTAVEKQIALTDNHIQKIQQQFTEGRQYLYTLNASLSEQQQQLAGFDRDAVVVNHIAYEAMDRDILSRYQALLSLHAHPETGAAAQLVSWLIKLFIVLLELTPLLAKIFFSQPSIYVELLRADLQLAAAQVRVDHKQKLQSLYRPESTALAPEVVSIAVGAGQQKWRDKKH
ncbi:MAG: DUF4407 domain-containing protein [Cellvibrionaceae bacterium]|nr:DUF4407 domain-containing protein [Cellvibrionaceae bacterium]